MDIAVGCFNLSVRSRELIFEFKIIYRNDNCENVSMLPIYPFYLMHSVSFTFLNLLSRILYMGIYMTYLC